MFLTLFVENGDESTGQQMDLGAISDFQDFQKGTLWTTFFAQYVDFGAVVRSSFDTLGPSLARSLTQNGPRTPRDQIFIDLEMILD